MRPCNGVQAYEGLQTAHKLKQEYVFLPAKLKEVYLTYLLEHLEDHKVHHTQRSSDMLLVHVHAIIHVLVCQVLATQQVQAIDPLLALSVPSKCVPYQLSMYSRHLMVHYLTCPYSSIEGYHRDCA